jgi:hypothetical protein
VSALQAAGALSFLMPKAGTAEAACGVPYMRMLHVGGEGGAMDSNGSAPACFKPKQMNTKPPGFVTGYLVGRRMPGLAADEWEVSIWDRMQRDNRPFEREGVVGTWLISMRSPFDIWDKEPTFLICELLYYIVAVLTFMHAKRHGRRYMWLWWATIAHGLMTECVSYWEPDIDNFWHAQVTCVRTSLCQRLPPAPPPPAPAPPSPALQSMLMLFGWREPFHIVLLYPDFIYIATVTVARLNLEEHIQPFAAALCVLMLDLPYDIMGIRLLWWTWHDTDSNIYDRHYQVPWCSYIFHLTFASAFGFILIKARR